MENLLDGNKLDDIIQRDGMRALTAVNEKGTILAMQNIEDGSVKQKPGIIIQAMVEHPLKENVHESALDVLWEMTKQGADRHLLYHATSHACVKLLYVTPLQIVKSWRSSHSTGILS